MTDHVLQVSEVGAKVGNAVATAAATVAVSNWMDWLTLENVALVTTIFCAFMGLLAGVLLNIWHKRRMVAIQEEWLEIQRQIAGGQQPSVCDDGAD